MHISVHRADKPSRLRSMLPLGLTQTEAARMVLTLVPEGLTENIGQICNNHAVVLNNRLSNFTNQYDSDQVFQGSSLVDVATLDLHVYMVCAKCVAAPVRGAFLPRAALPTSAFCPSHDKAVVRTCSHCSLV